MAAILGAVRFDEAGATVHEKYEEVGGRDERRIEIAGLITRESSVAGIEARLDAILNAASTEDYSAELSVREGRRLFVRRTGFSRAISADRLAGSFVLHLDAKDPFEESTEITQSRWDITESGAVLELTTAGNVFAKPVITLTAVGDLVTPSLTDGVRTMTYEGTVPEGSTLTFDAPAAKVTRDGEDVTPYTLGDFVRIAPEGSTLTYTDHASSSHTASATVTYRDRWW